MNDHDAGPGYRAATIGAVLAVLLAPAVAGAQRIPDRISDAEFWRMVTTYSEVGGVFASENFVSNENEWQYVIPGLLKRVAPAGVYLGVGPEQNFTYIAALQPRIAFICDIRRQNMILHLMYKALFEVSADRAQLLSKLWARPRPAGLDAGSAPAALLAAFQEVRLDSALQAKTLNEMFHTLVTRRGFALSPADSATLRHVYGVFGESGPMVNYSSRAGRGGGGAQNVMQTYFVIAGTDTVRQVVSVPMARSAAFVYSPYSTFAALMVEDDGTGINRGWLGSDSAFKWVKDFQSRNLLVPVVGDFAGPSALRNIGGYLKAHDARVSAFYVSNVEQYLFQQPATWRAFYRNVAELPTDSTSTFIRSLSFNYQWVRPVKTGSRMAQMTSSIHDVLRAFSDSTLRTYPGLIDLRHR